MNLDYDELALFISNELEKLDIGIQVSLLVKPDVKGFKKFVNNIFDYLYDTTVDDTGMFYNDNLIKYNLTYEDADIIGVLREHFKLVPIQTPFTKPKIAFKKDLIDEIIKEIKNYI